MMKDKKKIIRNLILFNLLIVITFYIIFKDQNVTDILNLLMNVKIRYILIAVLCMCIYVICDSINLGRTLKTLSEESSFLRNIKYSLIGFFFSGITPAASGGQPMQVYYMHKENISVANSTLALLINLSSMQIVTISIALISVIFNHQYLNTTLVWFFILGIALNASALTLLLLAIFSKNALQKMVNFIVKIMKGIRIKNVDKKQEAIEKEIQKYHNSSNYIINNKLVILRTLLTTYVQYIAFYSVSYWIYRSMGLVGYNIVQITTIQAILYATVSGIPSPGAVGVSEGGFIEIFKAVVPQNMINSTLLLTRGINFYFLIIVSGIVTIANLLYQTKLKKDE